MRLRRARRHLTSTTFIAAVLDGSGLALFATEFQVKGVMSQPAGTTILFVMSSYYAAIPGALIW
jgi:hypothetical protein